MQDHHKLSTSVPGTSQTPLLAAAELRSQSSTCRAQRKLVFDEGRHYTISAACVCTCKSCFATSDVERRKFIGELCTPEAKQRPDNASCCKKVWMRSHPQASLCADTSMVGKLSSADGNRARRRLSVNHSTPADAATGLDKQAHLRSLHLVCLYLVGGGEPP